MTFSPPIKFLGQGHKVGDWIKDLDGRTTHQPHSTLSLRSHKIPHHILPPSRLTNSDQVPILGFGEVCRTFGENGSNLNKGDSGDFCDLFTTPWALYEYSEIGRPWSADVWTKKISSRKSEKLYEYGKSGKIPRGLSMWSRNHTFLLGSQKGSLSNWPLEKIWIKWQLCTHAQSEKFWIAKARLLGLAVYAT